VPSRGSRLRGIADRHRIEGIAEFGRIPPPLMRFLGERSFDQRGQRTRHVRLDGAQRTQRIAEVFTSIAGVFDA
jgi:hypothetical protein